MRQPSTFQCGHCCNCRIFSWSHLEATFWLIGHAVSIGTFYYWCLVPFFEVKQQYVYGQSLVYPGTEADLFSARVAEYFFSLLYPLHLLLRGIYSLLRVPFKFFSTILPGSLFVYPPEAPLDFGPAFNPSVRTVESGRAPYLIDNSDGQYRELRNAFPSLVALIRYLRISRGEHPGRWVKVCSGRSQASTAAASASADRLGIDFVCSRGSSSFSCATDLADLLHPKSSSVARNAWIATQHIHAVFEFFLGLALAAYLHSVHALVLLFYALLNYSFTLLLPEPRAASRSGLSRASSGDSSAASAYLSSREPRHETSGSPATRFRRLDSIRCPLVILLTVGLHLGMLVLHGLTPHFSLVYIHPSLLPFETFCFTFLRPRYSLHDCVRMIALKMLAFNLDKVWAYQLRQKRGETPSETPTPHKADPPSKRRFAKNAQEQCMPNNASPSSCAAGDSQACRSEGPSRDVRAHASRVGNERFFAEPRLCPNPFEDERFFPSDSLSLPYSTYTSVLRYLAYAFYAPTYLAGPHFAYNSWNRQTAFPWWVLLGHNEYVVPSSESREREVEVTSVPLKSQRAKGTEEADCSVGDSPRSVEQDGWNSGGHLRIPPKGAALLKACASRALGVPLSASCRSPFLASPRGLIGESKEGSSGDETDLELRYRSRTHREKGFSGLRASARTTSRDGAREEKPTEEELTCWRPESAGERRGSPRAGAGALQETVEDLKPFGVDASPYLLDMPWTVYLELFMKHVVPYFLGWLLVLLVLEVHMRYLPVNARVTQLSNIPLWKTMQIWQLFTMSATVLCFMWLKFVCLWRFFRLWSMVAGAVPPENMVRFLYNNYSTEQFWRGWHRSFNLYLTRYMYIPMNKLLDLVLIVLNSSRSSSAAAAASPTKRQGSQDEEKPLLVEKKEVPGWRKLVTRSLSTFLIFLYVAMWHDFNANVFYWGLGCACGLVPETVIRYWAFLSPTAKAIALGDTSAARGVEDAHKDGRRQGVCGNLSRAFSGETGGKKEEDRECIAGGGLGRGLGYGDRQGKMREEDAHITEGRTCCGEEGEEEKASGRLHASCLSSSGGENEDVCEEDEELQGMDGRRRNSPVPVH
uniref:Uncharacterized protein n=1 Tax=Neospora caninum (strain Liverpool) TaxID=572307 RepID=F0JB33_NEOCL|nr:hypothetical protein NCLIV_069570 [Neospora caninum Liverpool]CEL71300.1 TPA: hypothetical protein BN1204_069570 [Neospora caninum Liverpool]